MRKKMVNVRKEGGHNNHIRGGIHNYYFKDDEEDTNDTWDDDHVTYGREY